MSKCFLNHNPSFEPRWNKFEPVLFWWCASDIAMLTSDPIAAVIKCLFVSNTSCCLYLPWGLLVLMKVVVRMKEKIMIICHIVGSLLMGNLLIKGYTIIAKQKLCLELVHDFWACLPCLLRTYLFLWVETLIG